MESVSFILLIAAIAFLCWLWHTIGYFRGRSEEMEHHMEYLEIEVDMRSVDKDVREKAQERSRLRRLLNE